MTRIYTVRYRNKNNELENKLIDAADREDAKQKFNEWRETQANKDDFSEAESSVIYWSQVK